MEIPLTGALLRLAGDVFDVARGAGDEPVDVVEVDEDAVEQERLRQSVLKLQLAYERASGQGGLEEVGVVVARALRDGREVLLAWLALLEEIVQVTERRFGTKAGQGKFKAAQAKAAVRRLLQRSDARTAAFVDLVGPSVIDLTTGWCIDLTAALLNSNEELWQAGAVGTLRVPLRTRVLAWLLRVLSWPETWFSSQTALDPQLYDEVDRIGRGPGSPLALVLRILGIGDWVVAHREQTVALVDLVTTACDEVEYFQSLESSESKHEYARNLIIVVLEDAGFGLSGGSLDVAEAVIDFMIEFVVATNNKRGRYQHGVV